MSSEVDIVNLALSHLGDEAGVTDISPPDGTTQAAHGARFYPIARGVLLEMFPWTFATTRVALAEIANPAEDDWSYAYRLPADCLRPLASLYPGVSPRALSNESDADSFPYIVESSEDGGLVLLTNLETARLRYIRLVTDTGKYTPIFTAALSRLLAAYLAGPVIKGVEGMKVARTQMEIFEVEFRKAAAANANTGKRDTYRAHTPAWLAGRTLPQVPEGYVVRS